MTISIVDYGVGNLGSIRNMLKKIGADAEIISDIPSIEQATKLILPGVGAFDAGMHSLQCSGLRPALEEAVLHRKVPVIGICLGMQMMTEGSEEGRLPGLGWVPARTVRFTPLPNKSLKVPHMGWNKIHVSRENDLIIELTDEQRFYFVHSYCVVPKSTEIVIATATHGIEFCAAFQRNHIYGVQFHPEKSHRFGMALMKHFAEI